MIQNENDQEQTQHQQTTESWSSWASPVGLGLFLICLGLFLASLGLMVTLLSMGANL